MRTVGDLMTVSPLVIEAMQSLSEALARMENFHVRHLPVIGSQGALVGMLSRCDVYRCLVASPGRDASAIAASEAMAPEPYWCSVDDPVAAVARDMADRKIGAAVVMEGDRIAGLFTTTDALRGLAATTRGKTPSPESAHRMQTRRA